MSTLRRNRSRYSHEVYYHAVDTDRLIGTIQNRIVFDAWHREIIRKYGINVPQNINDALTKKHLELKRKGE